MWPTMMVQQPRLVALPTLLYRHYCCTSAVAASFLTVLLKAPAAGAAVAGACADRYMTTFYFHQNRCPCLCLYIHHVHMHVYTISIQNYSSSMHRQKFVKDHCTSGEARVWVGACR